MRKRPFGGVPGTTLRQPLRGVDAVTPSHWVITCIGFDRPEGAVLMPPYRAPGSWFLADGVGGEDGRVWPEEDLGDVEQAGVGETIETMAFLRHLTTIGVIASEAAGYDWDQPVRMLAGRDAAIALGGSYDAGTLASLAGIDVAEVLDVFGFVPLPAGPRGRQATLAGGMALAVFRQSEHPDLAMQLLRRLTQPDALADAARRTAQIPPRGAAVKLVADDYPLLADTAAMLPNAVLRPALPSYPRVSEQLQAMLEGVLLGRRGPQEAVAHAAELVAAITGLPQAGESR